MPIDPELLVFLHGLQVTHPVAKDPNDLAAYVARYDAISKVLPKPHQVPAVTAGSFNLSVIASGEKAKIEARLYLPEGVKQPILMAYFHGGGWVAGSLSSHDMLCRQLSADLQIAVASIHIPKGTSTYLQPAEQALQVLMTVRKAREKLGVSTESLLVGGDGSGAHLGLQAAWRLARQAPGSVDAMLAVTPLVKPDFNTASYIRCANSLTFSRDDAVRSWHNLLGGRWETWDERAVLLHGNQPIQRPPLVVVLAAEQDGAHDDAVALHDWLREAGARCEFYGAPGMVHDFARYQHASKAARRLWLEGLDAFAELAHIKSANNAAAA